MDLSTHFNALTSEELNIMFEFQNKLMSPPILVSPYARNYHTLNTFAYDVQGRSAFLQGQRDCTTKLIYWLRYMNKLSKLETRNNANVLQKYRPGWYCTLTSKILDFPSKRITTCQNGSWTTQMEPAVKHAVGFTFLSLIVILTMVQAINNKFWYSILSKNKQCGQQPT